jgi:hypothetical protein
VYKVDSESDPDHHYFIDDAATAKTSSERRVLRHWPVDLQSEVDQTKQLKGMAMATT